MALEQNMDPITTAIVAAIASLAEPAAQDAYNSLKKLITTKLFGKPEVLEAVEQLEKKPDSAGRRETLSEEIVSSGAANDKELLAAAAAVLEVVKRQPGGEQTVQQVVTGNRNIFSGTGDIHIRDSQP